MTEKKDTAGKPAISRTPALDRLLRIPEGFTEKMKSKQVAPSIESIVTKVMDEAHAEQPKAAPQAAVAKEPSVATGQPRTGNPQRRRRPAAKPAAPATTGDTATAAIPAPPALPTSGGQAAPEQPRPAQPPRQPRQQQPRQPRQPRQPQQPKPAAQPQTAKEQPQAAPKQAGNNRQGGRGKPRQGQSAKPLTPATLTASALPQPSQGRHAPKAEHKVPLKIISLGGLGEIGKNITVYECQNEIVLVDCGLAFPDNDMLGVDLVIPDFTYLTRNREKIKGIFITHGHEDHIGGLAYLLKEINIPVYGTRFTIGLIEGKLKEHGLLNKAKLHVVEARDVIKTGCMSVEFIHVNHSIPDACALAIHTPTGIVVQTGDFKIDYTPIQGEVIDLGRFGELGDNGVLALLCDSTNAEKPGYTGSERTVGYSFDKLFAEAEGKRIIIATFASNVHRIQQVLDTAAKVGRKVAVFGRSMVNVVQKAIELGYMTVPAGVLIDIETMRNYTDGELVVMSTGSQGEPMSALTRMSTGEHRKVQIGSNDYVILSASPIPGNEKLVGKVINELMKLGAEVIYEKMYDVHVSGHACQDEIKTILALTKPRFFMPVHGEYKHLMKNASIAKGMGYTSKQIIISDIGKVIELDGVDVRLAGMVPSGRVLVDGLGVGDVGSVVLRDRKLLSEDGLIVAVISIDSATGEILAGPDMVSRGFVYVREAEDMMSDARNVVSRALEGCQLTGFKDWASIKGKIRDELSEYIYTRTKRKPMILPVIQEV
ncbi:MAG: ribonuclease J [Angelakisella sp.]